MAVACSGQLAHNGLVKQFTKSDRRAYDVVIVGGGFGGAFAARALDQRLGGRARRVLLVSPENFLTFTPLLPEAASGTIEPRHSVIPLRQILRHVDVVAGRVHALDLDARSLEVHDLIGEVHRVAYRALVLSPGAEAATVDLPGLSDHAVGFRTLPDAIWLRNRVLRQLEAAEAAEDRATRAALLTFTFIGGGYAGVEAVAELESLVRDACATYRQVSASDVRWVLVEAADSLLPGLDPRLAGYALTNLRARGVEVYLRTRMLSCEDGVVRLDDETVAPFASATVVWTAGQRPGPMLPDAGLAVDDRGRVVVDDHLRVPDHPGVFALGDAAAVPDPDGGTCPPTAQHAFRQGTVAGLNAAAFLGEGVARPFRYRTRGLAVTLGRGRGVAQVRSWVFTGWLAWWMGRSYHLLMLPGWARRLRIVSDWTLGLFFARDVSQLGGLGEPTPLPHR